MLSQTVVERLREAGHPVERLRFNVAPPSNTALVPVLQVGKSSLPESLERSIARIEDEELRLALGDAAAYSLAREK